MREKIIVIFLLIGLLVCCSGNKKSNDQIYKSRRSPVQNDFIKHGGYKTERSANHFSGHNDVLDVYNNKSNSIMPIPETDNKKSNK